MNSDELILHQATRKNIERFLRQPMHALILSGPDASGKSTLAKHIARQLLNLNKTQPITPDKILWLSPSPKQINIEQIRAAKDFAKMKQHDSIARIIVIEHSETMADPAQNALLKLLEEPSPGTVLILLTNNDLSLRATVRSRAQLIKLLKPSLSDFYAKISHPELEKYYLMTNGRAGLVTSLVKDGEDKTGSIQQAKAYLGASLIDKIIKNSNCADREEAVLLAAGIQTICRAAMKGSIDKGQSVPAQAWLNRYKAALQASQDLKQNANIKLALDWLALKLV